MENRFKRMIESLHREGACPRLQIDLTRDGVVCPDFVVEKWGERLIIDLDPSYPLNLEFSAIGVDVDLSFGGYVTRCTFPYASIYMIVDRANGRGMLFEENMPASVRRERGIGLAPAPAPAPALAREPAAAAKKDRGAGESRRRRRRPRADEGATETETEAEAEAAADEGASAGGEVAPAERAPVEVAPASRAPFGLAPAPEASDEDEDEDEDEDDDDEAATPAAEREREADRRRAIFKVIDGGK